MAEGRCGHADEADGGWSGAVTSSRTLSIAGLVIGAWAVLPPYIGPALATETRVEIADHVIPAVVILALSLAVLAAGRRAEGPGAVMLAMGLTVALAGLWMFLTHVPLLAQAFRGEAPMSAAVWHSLPGLAVIALGVSWALQHSGSSLPDQPEGTR